MHTQVVEENGKAQGGAVVRTEPVVTLLGNYRVSGLEHTRKVLDSMIRKIWEKGVRHRGEDFTKSLKQNLNVRGLLPH